MSETPRTEAIAGNDTYVPVAFARQLERELAGQREEFEAEIEKWRGAMADLQDAHEAEIARWSHVCAQADKQSIAWRERLEQAESARDAAVAGPQDEVLLKLIYEHFKDDDTRRTLLRTVWKDGIDIDEPSYSLKAFCTALLAAPQTAERSPDGGGKVLDGEWLIWSHEHKGYWPASRCGYVPLSKAGRFSFEEARQIVRDANLGMGGPPDEAMLPLPHPNILKRAAAEGKA